MADSISKQELNALPLVQYPQLRKKLRTADLLFASGNYWISRAIQKATGSVWSHVGIIVRIENLDRVMVLESVENVGVRLAPLSKYIDDYKDGRPYRGSLVVARVTDVNDAAAKKVPGTGFDELTRPYDKDEIAKIISRIALGAGRRTRDREYICSELVYECFLSVKRAFDYDHRGFITPENIWVDSRVRLMGRVH